MINENEIIDKVVALDGKISQETLDEMNPWVESHEKEQERRDKEEKVLMEKQELYQFEKDVDNNENDNQSNQNKPI